MPCSAEIIVAPFSNSYIRDWPIGHFTTLVGLLLDRVEADTGIAVIGTLNQRHGGDEVVRPYPATRVRNLCGRLAWGQVVERLRTAACVVSNNSGVGHLGGFFGVPTVCVFGGSHQRGEWRPRGTSVVLVSRAIGCSPCQLDHGQVSPYDKACLRQIEPERVADAAMLAMARAREAA
jgi:ADP-heptose:LPS heptosyltransferase